MRLTECLNGSDIRTLQRIALNHGLECHNMSKLSLMQAILSCLGRKEEVGRHMDVLPPLLRDVVILLACTHRGLWGGEELAALVRRVFGRGVEWREVLDPFVGMGWLFPVRGDTIQVLYHIPEEIREGVRRWVRETCRRGLSQAAEPLMWKDEGQAIVRDTAAFLAYVEQHLPALTAGGVLYRRHQQQVLRLMEIREDPIGPVTWRFGYGRRFYDYPDRFALIYDFCYAKGLIEERPGYLGIGEGARQWLSRADGDKLRDLFVFWRSLYRRAIPELPAALIWISEACAEGWIEEKRLDELLCPYVEGYYYEDAEAVKHRRVYAMLVHLGMLCRGVTEDGRTVYRTTALADHLWENWPEPAQADTTGGLIVQPHFEILVPPECMTRFALDLGAFADPLRGDVVHVYRITRHSIRRSIERGWSGPAIVGWLKHNSVQEVPGNVEMQILQWADRT